MRISIAEDNIHMRNIIRKMIEINFKNQISIAEYQNGYDMLRALPSIEPDVIILDIKMKKMDGLTALKEIKLLRPHLPIILITQFDTEEYRERAFELGAFDLISKSDLTKLINPIKKIWFYVKKKS